MEFVNEETKQELELSVTARSFLREAAKWAKVLAITGFVLIGLMVVLFFIMAIIMSSYSELMFPQQGELYGKTMAVFYVVIAIVFAVIYYFPIYYLYKFASKTLRAFDEENSEALSEAFRYLKNHYVYIGILMIICAGIYLLALIIVFLAALVTL